MGIEAELQMDGTKLNYNPRLLKQYYILSYAQAMQIRRAFLFSDRILSAVSETRCIDFMQIAVDTSQSRMRMAASNQTSCADLFSAICIPVAREAR